MTTSRSSILRKSSYPPEENLKTGDLIFCQAKWSIAGRGAGGSTVSPDDVESQLLENYAATPAQWAREREAWVREMAEVLARPGADPEAARQFARLRHMTYPEFRREFIGGAAPAARGLDAEGRPSLPTSQTWLSTAHVAIIDVEATPTGSRPVVVEASRKEEPPQAYCEWLNRFYRPFLVWQGRLRDVDPDLPAKAARLARDLVDRHPKIPFSIYARDAFDLDDDSGLYCAKLVWMAVWRESRHTVALDDKPNPKRWFWCTPFDILGSSRVDVVFDAGRPRSIVPVNTRRRRGAQP